MAKKSLPILAENSEPLCEGAKTKSHSKIEKLITDPSFLYAQPWFYNHPFALRCELGTGKSKGTYLNNAEKRGLEIYDILFPTPPDAVFFDYYIEDLSAWGNIIVDSTLDYFEEKIRFLAIHINNYESTVVSNIPLSEDEKENCVQKNRLVCYTDHNYPYKETIADNFLWNAPTVHFVSFKNECIFSVYDDRGCDVVFATKEKMQEFYNKLKPYFLEYDREEMAKRYGN